MYWTEISVKSPYLYCHIKNSEKSFIILTERGPGFPNGSDLERIEFGRRINIATASIAHKMTIIIKLLVPKPAPCGPGKSWTHSESVQ